MSIDPELLTKIEAKMADVRAELGHGTVADHYTEIWQHVKNLRQDFAPGKPGDPDWKNKMLSIAAIAINCIETATEYAPERRAPCA